MMTKNLFLLFSFFLLNQTILGTLPNPTVGDGFRVDWETDTKGTIVYNADENYDTPYSLNFNNNEFIETVVVIHHPNGQIEKKEYGKCNINRECNLNTMNLFAKTVKQLALQPIYNKLILDDLNYMLQNNFLKEGEDYTINQGQIKLLNTINFVAKQLPGYFRLTSIGGKTVRTNLSNGKKELIKF